jgi:uncharacterized protein YdhG (YjbR/CyaY superfamily)
MKNSLSKNIDEYIARNSPEVQATLGKIRAMVRKAAPKAEEKISYRIPAFRLDNRDLIYFAAFAKHIGIYPPGRGDAKLNKELARYRGPKGNLQFPLNEPMPYPLIRRVIACRLKEHREKLAAKRGKK